MADKFAGGIKAASTSVSIPVLIRSTSGGDVTALVAAGVTSASYRRQGAASVAITLSDLAAITTAWTSGGWKEVSSSLSPGEYRLDVPDLAFGTGVDWVTITVVVAGNVTHHERFNLESAGAVEVQANVSTRLATAGYTAPPTTAAIAAVILATPVNLLTTSATGGVNVTAIGGQAATAAAAVAFPAAVGTSTYAGGAVASVTGSVSNVTGSVGSVTGAVGSVIGSVGSVTGSVGSVTGGVNVVAIGGQSATATAPVAFPAAVGTSVYAGGAVASVTGAVGSVTGSISVGAYAGGQDPATLLAAAGYTGARAVKLDNLDAAVSTRSTFAGGAVASVAGAVGSVTGSVGSVTGSVGSVTSGVNVTAIGGQAASAVAPVAFPAVVGTSVYAGGAVASVTGAVGSVTGSVGSVTGSVGSVAGGVNVTAIGGQAASAVAPVAFPAVVGTSVYAGGAVASVTGAVGSVTGAVGSVTGSVGSVAGAVASVTGGVNVTAIGGQAASAVAPVAFPATVGTSVYAGGAVASVTGAVGSVTGAVGSVTGAVGSVTGAVGSVTGGVNVTAIGGQAASAVAPVAFPATVGTSTYAGGAVASVTGAVGSVTGAVASVTGAVGSVTGAVASVTGAVGSVTGGVSVGSYAAGQDPATLMAAAGYTGARAVKLDNLDATVSSRATSGGSAGVAPWLAVPPVIELAATGTIAYRIDLYNYGSTGALAAADSTPTFVCSNAAGTDLSSRLGSVTSPVAGQYAVTYTASSTDALEHVRIEASYTVGGVTRKIGRNAIIIDIAVVFTAADRAALQAVSTILGTTATGTIAGDILLTNAAIARQNNPAVVAVNDSTMTQFTVSGLSQVAGWATSTAYSTSGVNAGTHRPVTFQANVGGNLRLTVSPPFANVFALNDTLTVY